MPSNHDYYTSLTQKNSSSLGVNAVVYSRLLREFILPVHAKLNAIEPHDFTAENLALKEFLQNLLDPAMTLHLEDIHGNVLAAINASGAGNQKLFAEEVARLLSQVNRLQEVLISITD